MHCTPGQAIHPSFCKARLHPNQQNSVSFLRWKGKPQQARGVYRLEFISGAKGSENWFASIEPTLPEVHSPIACFMCDSSCGQYGISSYTVDTSLENLRSPAVSRCNQACESFVCAQQVTVTTVMEPKGISPEVYVPTRRIASASY